MKPFFTSLTLSLSLVAGMLYESHSKSVVKYEQVFGEQTLTLAEEMTLLEKLNLKNKNGFVKYLD
jgi:hypothetical protein